MQPGTDRVTSDGVILHQTTRVYTGPWLGEPNSVRPNAHIKTVVFYEVSWKAKQASGRLQLYLILGPNQHVIQTEETGSPPPVVPH